MLEYLNQVLGLSAEISPWEAAEDFPLYLQYDKKYYLLQICDVTCVLVEVVGNDFSVRSFRKQMLKLPSQSMPIVLCCHNLDSRMRKTLIEARIPFIVPGSQVYLPFLGIVLRERAKAVQSAPDKLSVAAQLILLFLIYERDGFLCRKVDFASRFNISAMDVTRAVRELAALELVKVQKNGRADWVSAAIAGRALYERALPNLIDPVKKRLYVRWKEAYSCFPLAGETALSQHSMLNRPRVECRAVYFREFNKLENIEIIDPNWTNCADYIELEIWKYDPRLLEQSSCVDVISLNLSLRRIVDERVDRAVKMMMEGYKW